MKTIYRCDYCENLCVLVVEDEEDNPTSCPCQCYVPGVSLIDTKWEPMNMKLFQNYIDDEFQ